MLVLGLALAGCNREDAADAGDAGPIPQEQAAAAAPSPAPAKPAAGVMAEIPDSGQSRIDGYGPLEFGLTPDEARQAWEGGLAGQGPSQPDGCFILRPQGQAAPTDLAFMFENELLVRYQSSSDAIAAPGGGKVGMSEADLRAQYAGNMAEAPHKYVQGAKTLTVETGGDATNRVVFETDAAGKVASWRVGIPPQVDYVEGCG
ncbi:MAG TPA: lectin [Luteimonas sp.]|nr:lectin [Luteimonas sp.]